MKNAYEFKKRCVGAFERLMKLSDFNSVYEPTEDYNEVKPLIDENEDALSDENDTRFDENHIDFDEYDAIEPQVNIKY